MSLHALLSTPAPVAAAASFEPQSDNFSYYAVAHFSPSMIIVFVVLLAAFFFMAFFAVYVRRCTVASDIDNEIPSYYYGNPSHLQERRWLWGRGATAAATATNSLSANGDLESGGVSATGIDPSVLDSFPLVAFSSVKRKGLQECVVCLADFDVDSDTHLRQLPRCKHFFHHACIAQWLELHSTCPLCRRSLLPNASSPSLFSFSFRSWGGGGGGGGGSSRGGGSISRRSFSGYGSGHGAGGGSVNRRTSTDVEVNAAAGDVEFEAEAAAAAEAEAARMKNRKLRRSFSTGWRRKPAMIMKDNGEMELGNRGAAAAAAAEVAEVAAEAVVELKEGKEEWRVPYHNHYLERSLSTK